MTKTTKKDNFNALLALAEVQSKPDLVAFIEHEIELLDKKNANRSDKPSDLQIKNASIKEEILNTLDPNQWYTLTAIKSLIPRLADSNGTQKVSRLCKDLAEAGKLQRDEIKRIVYYTLA